MACKQGISNLLLVLNRLCSEYDAMKYVLEHPPIEEHWRASTSNYLKAPKVHLGAKQRLDEWRESLRSVQSDDAIFKYLVERLNQTTLL